MTINPSFSYHLWKKLPLGVKIPLLITYFNAVNKINKKFMLSFKMIRNRRIYEYPTLN